MLRDWQVDLVASVLDPTPRPRSAGWMMPRGQGKSTLVAALGLFELHARGGGRLGRRRGDRRAAGGHRVPHRGPDGRAEPRAGEPRRALPGPSCVVPERGASFAVLPAQPKRLEGLDPSLAILDEIGVITREVYEVVALAAGQAGAVDAAGHRHARPGPARLRAGRHALLRRPSTRTIRRFVWREFSAAEFPHHPVDCAHCWELANPALDDFAHRDAMTALLPPKTRESTFRRARLCQMVSETDGAFLPAGVWDGLTEAHGIEDGAEVVIALDGTLLRGHDGAAGGDCLRRAALRCAGGVGARRGRAGAGGRRRAGDPGCLPPLAGRRDHR